MAFFGKRFQEDSLENVTEFLDFLGVDDNIRTHLQLLHSIDAVTSFTQSEEGTVTLNIEANGEQVLDLTVPLGEEKELTLPEEYGVITHLTVLEDNVLTSTVTYKDKSIQLVRTFEDDGYTMVVKIDGVDIEPTIHYKEVEE